MRLWGLFGATSLYGWFHGIAKLLDPAGEFLSFQSTGMFRIRLQIQGHLLLFTEMAGGFRC